MYQTKKTSNVQMLSFAYSYIVCVLAQEGGFKDSKRRDGASIMQMGQYTVPSGGQVTFKK